MRKFRCPYLGGNVELAEERSKHIAERHPDLLPQHRDKLAKTIARPDQVRRSSRFVGARLFSRWYDELRGGKHVVVVVVTSATGNSRHWIVTAYIARTLAEGEIEWKRN